MAVNPVTNKIYVACYDQGPGNLGSWVTVIDGATNSTSVVQDIYGPYAVAVNPVTNKIYVANYGDQYSIGSVTVIDGATNATLNLTTGYYPVAVGVNPVTNKIYVVNQQGGGTGTSNVTVVDGATNATTTVSIGLNGSSAVAVNPVTNKIYVNNSEGVTVIDGATNSTTTFWAYAAALAVNPVTNKIAATGGGPDQVVMIDGATNSTATVGAGTEPRAAAVNPVTNTAYVANYESSDVTVINGSTNATTTVTDPNANGPEAIAVNPMTNTIYVPNARSNNVTVIDGATNAITTVTDPNAAAPEMIAINPATNKIYVGNWATSNVTVIDGLTNLTTTVTDPNALNPWAIAVNPVTNKIYVANENSNNVTVIDGATNSTTTVSVGAEPRAVAVNSVTNKIYVVNANGTTVTVIDGVTNNTTPVTVGTYPYGVAVNPVTNKIYVGNAGNPYLTVIDGVTNLTTQISTPGVDPWVVALNPVTDKIYAGNYGSGTTAVIDGATNTVESVAVGSTQWAIAVNQFTNTIYMANEASNNVTVITEQQVLPIPIITAIAPLTNNQTSQLQLTFDFTATSSFTPTAPTPQQVWYQFDTWEGPWLATSGVAPNFSVTTSELPLGTHILYAFATDGQDANSTGMAQQLIGTMSAYLFEVVPTNTTATLTADPNPSDVGDWIQFIASVTANSPGSGTPTGTVTFFDGSTALDSASLNSNGQATFFTQTLAAGSHTITASYTGNPNFVGSTSQALTQQVNGVITLTPTSLVFGNQGVGTTSAPQAVTLTNTSGEALSFTSIEATTNFLQGNNCGSGVAVGGNCTINVYFVPSGTGPLSGALLIADNAADSPQVVYLSGTGTSTAILTVAPASLAFGNQVINETSAAKTVTLTNTGTVSVTISSITPSANFAISSNTCGATLAAGKKCTVKVTFTPAALGAVTGTLTFNDNAANSPQTVSLSGTGIVPATLTPASATYAKQTVGTTSAAKTFTLTNKQTVALDDIAISTAGDFAVSATTCTTSLAAKGTCTISVTFTPTATGTRTGQLSVGDSASNSPQTSNLTGTGK